ncbi:hypothetical protein QBC42DRAFT_315460 [Cladorrhinum samala]|uniref:Uncharacterized protein n=1 Tax=Cladorrhinum samala TaxID=585594 RepID=A0AAV9HWP1_9PEZI|nr:hypothetical protein QBC42DRAFT_315460 [Cladorrhinum samala]
MHYSPLRTTIAATCRLPSALHSQTLTNSPRRPNTQFYRCALGPFPLYKPTANLLLGAWSLSRRHTPPSLPPLALMSRSGVFWPRYILSIPPGCCSLIDKNAVQTDRTMKSTRRSSRSESTSSQSWPPQDASSLTSAGRLSNGWGVCPVLSATKPNNKKPSEAPTKAPTGNADAMADSAFSRSPIARYFGELGIPRRFTRRRCSDTSSINSVPSSTSSDVESEAEDCEADLTNASEATPSPPFPSLDSDVEAEKDPLQIAPDGSPAPTSSLKSDSNPSSPNLEYRAVEQAAQLTSTSTGHRNLGTPSTSPELAKPIGSSQESRSGSPSSCASGVRSLSRCSNASHAVSINDINDVLAAAATKNTEPYLTPSLTAGSSVLDDGSRPNNDLDAPNDLLSCVREGSAVLDPDISLESAEPRASHAETCLLDSETANADAELQTTVLEDKSEQPLHFSQSATTDEARMSADGELQDPVDRSVDMGSPIVDPDAHGDSQMTHAGTKDEIFQQQSPPTEVDLHPADIADGAKDSIKLSPPTPEQSTYEVNLSLPRIAKDSFTEVSPRLFYSTSSTAHNHRANITYARAATTFPGAFMIEMSNNHAATNGVRALEPCPECPDSAITPLDALRLALGTRPHQHKANPDAGVSRASSTPHQGFYANAVFAPCENRKTPQKQPKLSISPVFNTPSTSNHMSSVEREDSPLSEPDSPLTEIDTDTEEYLQKTLSVQPERQSSISRQKPSSNRFSAECEEKIEDVIFVRTDWPPQKQASSQTHRQTPARPKSQNKRKRSPSPTTRAIPSSGPPPTSSRQRKPSKKLGTFSSDTSTQDRVRQHRVTQPVAQLSNTAPNLVSPVVSKLSTPEGKNAADDEKRSHTMSLRRRDTAPLKDSERERAALVWLYNHYSGDLKRIRNDLPGSWGRGPEEKDRLLRILGEVEREGGIKLTAAHSERGRRLAGFS